MKSIQYNNTIDGEPEIKCIIDNMNFVNLWEGYFDFLMEYGKPNKNGMWSGILLTYHLHLGFYENPKWIVPSVEDFLDSLKEIKVPTQDIESLSLQKILIQLFQYAQENKLEIIIEYF